MLFLAVGLIMTGHAILTPLLMVIIMITGDFLGMSLTTDNVRPSPMPNAWRIGNLTVAGVIMGICVLVFCTGVLAVGEFGMGLGIGALRTLAFVASCSAVRRRSMPFANAGICGRSRPSLWLVVSSVADIVIASNWPSAESPWRPCRPVVAGTLAAAAAFAFVLDFGEGSRYSLVSRSSNALLRGGRIRMKIKFKGFSRARKATRSTCRNGRPQRRSRVQVEEAISEDFWQSTLRN